MIWKLLLWADRIVFWSSCALFFISLSSRSFARGNPIEQPEDQIEFPPSPAGYSGSIMMAASLPLILKSAFQHSQWTIFDYITASCVALIAIEFCLGAPGTISLNSEGLTQRFWFRKIKHILWKDIVEIKTTIRGPVEITSNNRTKISHSLFLAGRDRFLLELKKNCADELPTDFPREPMEAIEPQRGKKEKG